MERWTMEKVFVCVLGTSQTNEWSWLAEAALAALATKGRKSILWSYQTDSFQHSHIFDMPVAEKTLFCRLKMNCTSCRIGWNLKSEFVRRRKCSNLNKQMSEGILLNASNWLLSVSLTKVCKTTNPKIVETDDSRTPAAGLLIWPVRITGCA